MRNYSSFITCKGKAVPLQVWSGPEGSRKLRFPDFMTMAQDGGKVVSLTHRPPLPPGNTPGTHFCQRLSRSQGHSMTGRIMSLKNSNDTIGNRTRNLPVCSIVPYPPGHRAPHSLHVLPTNMYIILPFTYYDQCLYCLKQYIMSDVIQLISENTACVSTLIDQHLCTILGIPDHTLQLQCILVFTNTIFRCNKR